MYFNLDYYKFYIYASIIYICMFYIYFFSTKFKRIITIKDDFIIGINKEIYNIIHDTNNNIYIIDNRYMLLHFNAAEILSNIEKNRKFQITGYGIRIPFLNLYENIIELNPSKQ
jgi:hypothetical protein